MVGSMRNTTTVDDNNDLYVQFKVVVDVYIVVILCVFGISGNILSIAILGRDSYVRRTTGFLLQMVALADALYLTTCLFFQVRPKPTRDQISSRAKNPLPHHPLSLIIVECYHIGTLYLYQLREIDYISIS